MAAPKKSHCKRGHPRTPDNVYKDGGCITCKKDFFRKRHKEDPDFRERVRATKRKWRENNPERESEYVHKRFQENPERVRSLRRVSNMVRWSGYTISAETIRQYLL